MRRVVEDDGITINMMFEVTGVEDREIQVIKICMEALETLRDKETQNRVLSYLRGRVELGEIEENIMVVGEGGRPS